MANPNLKSSQAINGNLTVNGDLDVTGSINQGLQQTVANVSAATGLLNRLTGQFAPPGTIWNNVANPFSTSVRVTAIEGGGGVVIGTDLAGNVSRSTDSGKTWSVAVQPFGAVAIYSCKFGNGTFIIGSLNGTICYSNDLGVTWSSPVTVVAGQQIFALGFGNNIFIAGANNGNTYVSSNNGVSWGVGVASGLSLVASLTFGGGDFFLGGMLTSGNTVAVSINNGTSWTLLGNPLSLSAGGYVGALTYGNGVVIIGSIQNNTQVALSRDNGTSWTLSSIPNLVIGGPSSIAFGTNTFVTVTTGGIFTSFDLGITWSVTPGSTAFYSIGYLPTTFIAGNVGFIAWSSWLSYGKSYLYVPSFQGFGTPTGVSYTWQRPVGSNTIKINGAHFCGTNTAVEARIYFPVGLISDSNMYIQISPCGIYAYNQAGAGFYVALIEPGKPYFTLGIASAGAQAFAKQNGNAFLSGSNLAFSGVEISIAGWN